jgi:hypothetical protein
MRRLEELDRVDSEQGLGAMPLGTPAGGGGGGGGRRRRRRRTVGAFWPGLLISAVLAGAVLLYNPSMTGYRFRQIVDQVTGHDQGSYAFMVTSASGDPIGWNHCEPIHYVVNPAGAPDGWADIVQDGVATAAQASGFRFEYDGTSTDRSFTERDVDDGNPPPLLIAWANADEVPKLAGSTAGIGGSTPTWVSGRVRLVTGLVVLDSDAYDRMAREGNRRAEQMILAHELGHVLGLDHVEDRGELMYPEYVGQDGFGPGDRRGLERLYELPCR